MLPLVKLLGIGLGFSLYHFVAWLDFSSFDDFSLVCSLTDPDARSFPFLHPCCQQIFSEVNLMVGYVVGRLGLFGMAPLEGSLHVCAAQR